MTARRGAGGDVAESEGKRGRPKKAQPRERVLQVRLDDDELLALQQKANAEGLTLAAWARSTLLRTARAAVNDVQ